MSNRPSAADLLAFDCAAVVDAGARYVIGVDEVGRGCLAGPLVAGAVLVEPATFDIRALTGLGDSKKLTAKKREALYPAIEDAVTAHRFAERDAAFIDRFGIQRANNEAMIEAIEDLLSVVSAEETVVLVDGIGIKVPDAPAHVAVVKGDGRSAAIAGASVLAKVHRDRQMIAAALIHPEYGFDGHKGYGAASHREAIAEHGFTELHRRSFCRNIEVRDAGETA